jgi:hypothetical protein
MAAVRVALSSLQNLWGFRELFARPGLEDVAVSVETVESRGRDDDLMGRRFALGASSANQPLRLCLVYQNWDAKFTVAICLYLIIIVQPLTN